MRNTILIIAGLFLLACNNTPNHSRRLPEASWLLGQWQNISEENIYTEIWSQLNDSVFTAESYYIMGTDTPSRERIRLEQHGAELFYIPTVDGQNNNQPVSFKLTKNNERILVFENPDHDFPKSIVYTLIDKDSMVASVSGPTNGKQDTLYFPMRRVEN